MAFDIETTLPNKMGKINSINGLPFNDSAASFEKRLKKSIKKIFSMGNMDSKYWELLKKMILNPDELFGLVAIDGFVKDVMGNDDIALIFNMGLPRLRGRKVNYLGRIYMNVGTGTRLKFWNSSLDTEDLAHFDFAYTVPAWHPHISDAQPCLGGYSNEVSKWKAEGNPIMFLKTMNSYLNTWNTRSPFWNLNRAIINHKANDCDKSYSTTILNAVCYQKEATVGHGISPTKVAKFVNDNIGKINTKSITNDLHCMVDIYHIIESLKITVSTLVTMHISEKNLSYLNAHNNDVNDRNENRRHHTQTEYSILPFVHRGRTTFCIPVLSDNGKITRFMNKEIMGNIELRKTKEYNIYNHILRSLSRVIYSFSEWIYSKEMIQQLFDNTDYAIDIYSKYIAPNKTRARDIFDDMTISGIYDHRITRRSNETKAENVEHYLSKEKIKTALTLRKRRTDKLLLAFYKKELTKEFTEKCISEQIKSYFSYTVDITKEDEKNKIHSLGSFWRCLSIYQADEDFYNYLNIIESYGKIDSLDSLIYVYETIKYESITSEADSLINEYDKIIRSLKKYGNNTEDTAKDTQQVHLSFK